MDILQECSGAKIIGISAHVRPDGDAIGSGMALYAVFEKEDAGSKNPLVFREHTRWVYPSYPFVRSGYEIPERRAF